MVSTSAPSHCTARMVQLLIEAPSTWTTQAPHWLVSQPTWVPVRPSFSRNSWTSNVRGSTSAEALRPFTVRETLGIDLDSFEKRRSGGSAGSQANRRQAVAVFQDSGRLTGKSYRRLRRGQAQRGCAFLPSSRRDGETGLARRTRRLRGGCRGRPIASATSALKSWNVERSDTGAGDAAT